MITAPLMTYWVDLQHTHEQLCYQCQNQIGGHGPKRRRKQKR